MFYLPTGFFLALIIANFFSQYLSFKEVVVYVLIFLASFLIPSPFPIVLVVILDVALLIKFKLEHF
jgi:hypothetical protein